MYVNPTWVYLGFWFHFCVAVFIVLRLGYEYVLMRLDEEARKEDG